MIKLLDGTDEQSESQEIKYLAQEGDRTRTVS